MDSMSLQTVILIAVVFALAGFVKGVVGLGLPTVSLALLTATIGLKEAIALMLVPALLTNVWQGFVGGAFTKIVRRIWTLLITSCIGIWIGTGVLAGADATILAGLFGVLLCAYSSYSLAMPQIPPPGRHEGWLSPTIGAVAGVVTGLTGSYTVPGVLYLQALGQPRDVLVQTMGIVFVVLTIALAVSLSGHDLLPAHLGLLSAGAFVPTAAGMMAGQTIRRRLPEDSFRTVFFVALLVIGLYIAGRAFL